MIVLSHYM